MYCGIVPPHREYAIEANAPKLWAVINLVERVQCFETHLMSGLRYVPYEERLNLTSSRWNTDASEVT